MNIFVHAMKEATRYRINLVLVFLLPFPLLLIPAEVGAFPFGLSLYGLLVLYTAFLLGRPIAEDRIKGIIVRIAASPLGVWRYLGGHLAAGFLLLGVQISLFLIGSYFVHGLATIEYLHLFLLYLSFSVFCTSFALAWNNLFRSFNVSLGLFSGIGSVLCLVSGVSLPLMLIPQQIRNVTMFLPTYWLPFGIEALHAARYGDLLLSHAILVTYAAILFIAGTVRKL